MCYAKYMNTKRQNRIGITFIEVTIAALLLAIVLLPTFQFLTNAVKDTERVYVETIAMSRAKQVMDTMLFQIPWRAIREGNPCKFADPEEQDSTEAFLASILPEIFGAGCETSNSKEFIGDGMYTTDKGFVIRARAKVVDLDYEFGATPLSMTIESRTPGEYKEFKLNELTAKDADDKYNLVKKIVVQVKWSLKKGMDPNKDDNAKSLFLVGFKSNIEG